MIDRSASHLNVGRPFQREGLIGRAGPFVAVAVVITGLLPFRDLPGRPSLHLGVLLVAVLAIAVFAVPWDRLPRWTDAVVPLLFLVAVGLLRDAEGGRNASTSMLVLLPVVWFALFGRKAELVVAAVGAALVFLIPPVLLGGVEYPLAEIFRSLVNGAVTGLVAFAVYGLIAERTSLIDDLDAQAHATRQILEAAHDAYVSIDDRGLITDWNPRAVSIFGWSREEALGKALTDTIIPTRYREAHDNGIKRFRATGAGPILNQRIEISAIDSDGREFPVELVVWPVHEGPGLTFSALIHDISDRKRAEGYQRAQRDVAAVLADDLSVAQAMPAVIEAVGTSMGWEFGAFWTVDDEREQLGCDATWSLDRAEVKAFAAECQATRFDPGVGLPGRVWLTGVLTTVEDTVRHSTFPRASAARAAGLHEAVALPLCVDQKFVGAMEFFTTDTRVVDQELCEMMTSIGTQVEQFLERKHVESALSESETKHRRLADQLASAQQVAHIGSWGWDVEPEDLTWSDELYRIYGYEPQQFDPTFERFLASVHPEDRVRIETALEAASETGGTFEFDHRIVRPDDDVRVLRCLGEVTLRPNGTVARMSGTGEDITDRALVAADLAASEESFRSLAESAPVGVFQTDASGQCIYTNARYQDIFGLSADEALGDGWTQAIHPDDRERIFTAWEQSATTSEGWTDRYRTQRADGTLRWVDGRAGALHGQQGEVIGFVGTTADITPVIEAEHAVVRARDEAIEMSRLKSEFVANMSHEIRTPLNGILGIAEVMLDGDVDREQRDHLDMLGEAGRSLLRIIDDVLDFSKGEAGKLELDEDDFDLWNAVEGIAAVMTSPAGQKMLELVLEIRPDVPHWVRGDPSRLRQILINLIGNAVKFTEVGRVMILVVPSKAGEVRFEVSDTGIGIDKAARARILEPFAQAESSTTRRYGGTGLGLSICLQLVGLMGGTLELESEPNQGTTFAVSIPLPSVPPPSRQKTAPPPVLDRSFAPTGARALVVEDAPVNQLVARAMLRRLGYQSDVVSNGAEAVDAARETRYDVILMDCLMPVMDGYQATAGIRSLEGSDLHTPIIALTASAMAGDRERCLKVGMDDYLAKPFDAAALAGALDRCISPDVASESVPAAPGSTSGRAASTLPDAIRSLEVELGATAFQAVCKAFRDDAGQGVRDLETAIAEGDWDTASRLAHKLKGTALSLGAHDLGAVLHDVENGLGPDGGELTPLLDGLKEEVAAAITLMERASEA